VRGKLVGHQVSKVPFKLVQRVEEKTLHRDVDLSIVLSMLFPVQGSGQFRGDEGSGLEEKSLAAVGGESVLDKV